ncbi:MAG TPA: hypothetical protein VMQ61_06930 [Thermoanaerobaculia bacterium]|nr:hypothetical protein [Thermoanaerobaculia bacterium]
MRITDLRLARTGDTARATARVTWEETPRPPFDLFFETAGPGAEDFGAEPEAFFLASVLPAMKNRERRVFVEGTLCPRLADGVTAAIGLLEDWYGPPRGPVAIEASEGFRALTPREPPRAAFFLTGGVDSLHLLHMNRAHYPARHPAHFRDAISVFGHLCAEGDESPWNDRVRPHLAKIASKMGLDIVFFRTNVWRLEPDLAFVAEESLSASLLSNVHLLRRRWSRVSIATGRFSGAEVVRGTHPMLDPLYATSALDVRHDANPYKRFQRLAALSATPGALEDLVVCLAYPDPPALNCGRCEKCLRTMTQLVALGRLEETPHFPNEVGAEAIRRLSIKPVEAYYWNEILPLLGARGREDLVAAIRERLAETRRFERWSRDEGWKGRLRKLDRRFLGGRLLELRKRMLPAGYPSQNPTTRAKRPSGETS